MQQLGPQGALRFEHETIDADPPCARLGFCMTTDLTGNGRDDLIVGGMGSNYSGKSYVIRAKRSGFPTFDRLRDAAGLDEVNLFWYENPGWERHSIAFAPFLDVGGALGDITGNGRMDIVAGQSIFRNDVYWFEQPENPRDRWTKRTVTDAFEKYHDLTVADVDNDGDAEVVGLSQESQTLFYLDIPADPFQEPWPDSHLRVIDDDIDEEGLLVVDVDGDGQNEVLAGPNRFRRVSEGHWERERIATGWDYTRIAAADIDGDGDLEVILSEGDSPKYGSHPGRVAWFDPPGWEPTFLKDDLFCPHSLQVADFDGDGRPDVFVGEMGLGSNDQPTHYLFRNCGNGTFEETVIANGIETHEAKAVDMTGNGRPDVVGKSYTPDHHVDIWHNRS